MNKKQVSINIDHALNDYQSKGHESNQGYNILRYIKFGWVGVSCDVDPCIFASWYPNDMGYVFLRLAQQGKLVKIFNEME